jgi:hypothetical protein
MIAHCLWLALNNDEAEERHTIHHVLHLLLYFFNPNLLESNVSSRLVEVSSSGPAGNSREDLRRCNQAGHATPFSSSLPLNFETS